ncbi:hypothetical protein CCP4SC76_3940002 [Gammaproteobacteria bacterium]
MVAPVRRLKPTPNLVSVADPSVGVGVRLQPEGTPVQPAQKECTGCPDVTWKAPPTPGYDGGQMPSFYRIEGSMLIIQAFTTPRGVHEFTAIINGVECPVVVQVEGRWGFG